MRIVVSYYFPYLLFHLPYIVSSLIDIASTVNEIYFAVLRNRTRLYISLNLKWSIVYYDP